MLRDAAGVVEQLTEGDGLGVGKAMEPGLVADPAADLNVKIDFFLVDPAHNHSGKIGLADTSGQDPILRLHRRARFRVRISGADGDDLSVRQNKGGGRAGKAIPGAKFVQLVLEPLSELDDRGFVKSSGWLGCSDRCPCKGAERQNQRNKSTWERIEHRETLSIDACRAQLSLAA